MHQAAPAPEKLRSVADRLRRSSDERMLSMLQTDVRWRSCGTFACLAGHWLDLRKEDEDAQHLRTDPDNPWHWRNGADLLSQDLGTQGAHALMQFADSNPGLWGNSHGLQIFADRSAWTEESEAPARSLRDVADHMDRVAKRIEASKAL